MQDIQLSDHFTYKKLIKFVLPSVAMLVFISVYGVVDGFFVSNFAGKTAFAGLNFIMPFIMILATPGFMMGTGGSALVARIFGEGDKERGNSLFSFFCVCTLVLAFAITVAGFAAVPLVAKKMGAEGSMLHYAILYGRIVVLGTIPQTFHFLFQGFIVVSQKPELGLKITVASGLANIVLDALFVWVLKWGVAGAAAATVISQLISGLAPVVYYSRPNDSLLRIGKFRFDGKALLKACGNGSSELMSNISMSLVGILYNIQLMKYFGENGVAAYGVMMYLNFVFISAFIGYAVGSSPIVSFHFGAQNRAELKNMLSKSVFIILAGSVFMFVLGELCSGPFSALYVKYDPQLYEITVHGFRIFSASFLFCGFAIYFSSFFTALNNGLVSAVISFLRTLVFQVAAVFLLPLVLGPDGVWYSIPVAEIMAVILSLVFVFAKKKHYGY